MSRRDESSAIDLLLDPDSLRLPTDLPLAVVWGSRTVRLEASNLVFDWGWDALKATSAKPGMLEQFLALERHGEFLDFAVQFGPLGLNSQSNVDRQALRMFPSRRRQHRESLEGWRGFQQRLKLGLEMAAVAHSAPRALPLRLAVSVPTGTWVDWPEKYRQAHAGRECQSLLDDLSRVIGLRFSAAAGASGKALSLAFRDEICPFSGALPGLSVAGALVAQLLAATTQTHMATCSECGRVFVPKRMPARGRRRFCRACRDRGVAGLLSTRDWRARQRSRT